MTGNEETLDMRIRKAIEASAGERETVELTFAGPEFTAFPPRGFASVHDGEVRVFGPAGRGRPRSPAEIGAAEAAGIIVGPRGARPEIRRYLRNEAARHARLCREIRGEAERHFKLLEGTVTEVQKMFEGGTAPGNAIDKAEGEAYRELNETVDRILKFRDARTALDQITGHGAMQGTGPEEAEALKAAETAIQADWEALLKLHDEAQRLAVRADYFAVRTARA